MSLAVEWPRLDPPPRRVINVRVRRFCALCVLVFVAGCGGTAAPSPSTTSSPSSTLGGGPTTASSPSAPVSDATLVECGVSGHDLPHQSTEIEALLPPRVAGRDLARWSAVGRCWLGIAVGGYPGGVDGFLASINGAGNSATIDLSHLVYGVAGRSNTQTDPPYFVWAAGRPDDETEIAVATLLLFGGAGFQGGLDTATNLTNYTHRVIDGRDVYVGDASMVTQDSHQSGRPYLYQTDAWMFIVLTDDEAWATDAIQQLP
jgi:hypothetical protein